MPPLLPAPQRRLLSTIALLVLSLTLYSSYAGLSSNPVPSPSSAVASLSGDALPPSAWAEQLNDRGYFAQKGNVFNQWFAKKAWAWTTVPFVAHALLHPPRATTATSRLRSLTKYAVATAYWAVLTLWAVGPSLFERTMVYTGGECSVVVPRSACASGEVDCSAGVAVGKGALIRIPQEFCHVRLPSAGLAARLSESLKAAGEDGAAGAFHRETVGEWWASLHPRWSGGHDVSGHVFLLTLSAVLLLGEVWPTLVQLRRAGWDVGQVGLRAYVALTGAALVALWVFILTQTSIWFHTVLEKLTGLLVASVGITLVQYVSSFV